MAKVQALALVLIVIAVGGNAGMAGAQSTPPNSSPSSCTASLVSLAPCLTFLQGGPNNSSPTQGCCTSLASVVSTNAACLCQLFTTNNPLGIPVNQTRALTLPGACKISTPPVSQCKSPAVSSPPAPTTPSSPTPAVSNPTPTAKSPATSAALPPTATSNSGGAASPSAGSHEGPSASANAGSMTVMSMLINVVGIMGGSLATYILSASSM